MFRSLYLTGFSLVILSVFLFFPTACSKTYSVTAPKNKTINPGTGQVTTLAGSGTATYSDGIGTSAAFSFPTGVAVDPSGNVYVADLGNNLVRKITADGMVTKLAGTLVPGVNNGPGSIASFFFPQGVAADASGNVYVADQYNNLIRKINPGDVVSTLAGMGLPGYANGPGNIASFDYPEYVAVDSSGNLYIGDTVNSMVRKITPDSVVSTLAGSGAYGSANGPGSTATFSGLCGVAVDYSGNVYVADTQNCLIRKITPGGVVSTLAGSGLVGSADGPAATASFNNPSGVAVDPYGNVFVADTLNNTIREITASGVVTTLAGSAGVTGSANGPLSSATFNNPFGIAVDSSGTLYIADTNNNLIRKIQ